jgi:3',5'-cyclic AMP phosphodiesterase CpdA
MIISDIHYSPVNPELNQLGYTADQRIQMAVDSIMTEYNGRGLDAVLILGDLSTDNYTAGSVKTNYCKDAYEKFLKDLPVPVYVLPGNHDSYTNDMWKEMFGYNRQFTVYVGNTLFIMLDTFTNGSGNGNYKSIDTAWLKTQLENNKYKNIVICAHYITQSSELAKLVSQYPNIIGMYHGHTHKYTVEQYNGVNIINTGDFAYSTLSDAGATKWNFGFLDLRSLFGYMILEWSDVAAVTYHISVAAHYCATNFEYIQRENIRSREIFLK